MKNIRENKVKRFTPFGFLKKTGIFHTIFIVFCWNIGKNVIPLFTSLITPNYFTLEAKAIVTLSLKKLLIVPFP